MSEFRPSLKIATIVAIVGVLLISLPAVALLVDYENDVPTMIGFGGLIGVLVVGIIFFAISALRARTQPLGRVLRQTGWIAALFLVPVSLTSAPWWFVLSRIIENAEPQYGLAVDIPLSQGLILSGMFALFGLAVWLVVVTLVWTMAKLALPTRSREEKTSPSI